MNNEPKSADGILKKSLLQQYMEAKEQEIQQQILDSITADDIAALHPLLVAAADDRVRKLVEEKNTYSATTLDSIIQRLVSESLKPAVESIVATIGQDKAFADRVKDAVVEAIRASVDLRFELPR